MEKKNEKKNARVKRQKYNDPFGFTKAINWDVFDKMTPEELKAVSDVLKKVK